MPLAQPSSAATWNVYAEIRDKKAMPVEDAVVNAGPVGALVSIPFVAPYRNQLASAFTGAFTNLQADVDRGTAWLHGAKITCPSFHTFTWTATPLGDGTEKVSVTWTPNNEPGVEVQMAGTDVDHQTGVADTGQHEWTQAAASGSHDIQVLRRTQTMAGTSAALECMIRVTSML